MSAMDTNGFDWRKRLAREAARVADLVAGATPPAEMAAAPVAPARGTMRLQASYVAAPGGTRRRDGAHWREACALEVMVAQALLRHEARGLDPDRFVPPFTPGQIAVAGDYRALVEWREGSAIKCASLEAGRAGGGAGGLFIDTFIDQGRWLAELHARIGAGAAMVPQRSMDRGNARRRIPDRALVDQVVLQSRDLSAVLRRYGWAEKGSNRRALREALSAALDRMMGYSDAKAQNGGLTA